MKKLLWLAFAGLFVVSAAHADFTGKNAAGNTITFKNSVDCTVGSCVPLFQFGDGTNTTAVTTAGADGASNTANGLPVYARPSWFNGTTWDRAQGDATNGAWVNVKTSVLPTGGATSANQSSQLTQETNTATVAGTTSDTAYNGSGNSTLSAALRGIYAILSTINTNVQAAIAAGTNTIGNIGFDPSQGKGTPTSTPINVSTATTTQLVAISGSTKIYVTSFDVIAGGTGNITFEYGTGSNCGTGTTALTGAYNLTAQVGISKGTGTGPVLIVPAGNALCVLTSAAVQMSGSVSYQQF